MIKEYDLVKTLVEKCGYPKGTKGVIVGIYKRGEACNVELWDKNNYPIDVITYTTNEIEIINEIIDSIHLYWGALN